MTSLDLTPDDIPFTVVIPTRNEPDTAVELLTRLVSALGARTAGPVPRLLFVDDSTDHTPTLIRAAARDCPLPVTLLHREDPDGGLGGAVTEGLRAAEGEWAVVMGSGFAHLPQLVPQLVAAGRAAGADLAVAAPHSPADADGRRRRHLPRPSALLTRLLFARELRRISDPTSGLFAVRRGAVDLAGLHLPGPRILMELAVRGGLRRIVEVSYRLGTPLVEKSGTGLHEGLLTLAQLARLRLSTPLGRAVAFALIGLSGLLPNLLVLELLTNEFGVYYLPAAILANQAGIAWNFFLLERSVYRHRRYRHAADRVLRFFGVSNLDLLLRIPLMTLMVSGWGLDPALATVLALVVSCLLRFTVAERAIYLPAPLRRGRTDSSRTS
ncbi:glycosyltransferase [Kitasatospora sp. NPDC051914]|uniref:GtrA family protein n=1 Tax=Kitasatospora sp. NPDC051914 TaxID=3154945 RepID=UPI0034235126